MFFYSEPDIVTQDPYFYNTSLLLNMDSNFSDSSVYQNSATTGGGVSISTVDFKYGDGSGYFNGNGDAISIVSSDSLDLSGQDWTIETWIRPNGDYSNWRMILAKRNSSGDYNYQLYLDRYTGELRFYPGGAPSDVVTGVTPQANVWSHVAVARSNGTVTVYLNGNSVGSMVSDTDFNSAPLGIGCVANGVSGFGGHGFFGHIDDVRITKGVARYTTNFTPPTQAHPTVGPSEIVSTGLQLHLDAGDTASYPGTGTTWTDLSGNGYNGTLVDGVDFDNANGGSLVFDASNDYVSLPKIITTTDFTVCQFIRQNSDTTDEGWTFEQYDGGAGRLIINTHNLNSTQVFRFFIGGVALYSSTVINSGQTYFITYSRSGSTAKIYINGILDATTTSMPSVAIADTTSAIGGSKAGNPWKGQYEFIGNIYNTTVYNKALTDAEVLQNFHATKDRFGL